LARAGSELPAQLTSLKERSRPSDRPTLGTVGLADWEVLRGRRGAGGIEGQYPRATPALFWGEPVAGRRPQGHDVPMRARIRLVRAGTRLARTPTRQPVYEEEEIVRTPESKSVDDSVLRTLAEGSATFAAFATDRRKIKEPAWSAEGALWLTSSRTTLTFRTNKGARSAALQLAREGYTTLVGPRWLMAEAPWLVVSAVMAVAGLGTEVLGAQWAKMPSRGSRSGRRPAGNA